MAKEKRQGNDAVSALPAYLKQWPGLYVRQGDRIVEASPEDVEVAKRYPLLTSKGPVVGGRRLTVICRKDTYRVDEEVRVIHVLDVIEAGKDIFVMGPKPVCGEYVDGRPTTPEECPEPVDYDGRVLKSPAVDYNYDITTYTFKSPGKHQLHWQIGQLRSNSLEFEVVAS